MLSVRPYLWALLLQQVTLGGEVQARGVAAEQPLRQTELAPGQTPHTGQLWAARLWLSAAATTRAETRLPIFWRGSAYWAYRVADGLYEALLPMPLEAPKGPLWLDIDDGTADVRLAVDVVDKAYPVSKLSVAPRFSTTPPPEVGAQREAIAKAMQSGHSKRLFTQSFIKPCQSPPTSPFGVRRTFNGVTKTRHLGLDLQSRIGEPVFATNDGVVALAARQFFYTGNAVFIDHGEGLFTGVFHLSEMVVESGQQVRRGQLIGRSGNTGRVTGPHVHFCVKLAGSYVDPDDLLDWVPEPFGLCEPGFAD